MILTFRDTFRVCSNIRRQNAKFTPVKARFFTVLNDKNNLMPRPSVSPSPGNINSDITGLSMVGDNDTVHVAMSGGVDSSTTAAILADRFGPARVKGVFMNNWSSGSKCQEYSWRDVCEISKVLGIRSQRIDLENDYWTDVFDPMLQAYQQGYTPNPDVSCNKYIKFGNLLKELKRRDPALKWLATGHYAGLSASTERLIRRPRYLAKDQSYYLSTVSIPAIQHALFPLAELTKPEVRDLARTYKLDIVAEKPDSQGLCFVEQQQDFGARGFRKFLSEYLVESPGPIVLASNPETVVGEHRGLWTHTVGQRASISMSQSSPEQRGKWFVVAKDQGRNALIIDRGSNAPTLFANQLESHDFVWHRKPTQPTLFAQYRSLQDPWKVESWFEEDAHATFKFDTLRRAVAPGQYLVIYENDIVIGSGVISSALQG